MDQMGTKHDSKSRLKMARKYLFESVQFARNAIYNVAAAIGGSAVDRLLKATSSVPTLVSPVPGIHLFRLHVLFLECIY